jgi:hypothetical protein
MSDPIATVLGEVWDFSVDSLLKAPGKLVIPMVRGAGGTSIKKGIIALTLARVLERLFPESKTQKKVKQALEDDKHVVKVSDACKVVDEKLSKLREISDLAGLVALLQDPGQEKDLKSQIILGIQEEALRQDTPRTLRTKHGWLRPAKGHGTK